MRNRPCPPVRAGFTWAGRNIAARQGIDPAALGEEEWIIRTVGQDLVLTGGRPRGTMYAVYEFLERQVGCHWLDRETEIVPSRPTLAVDALDVRAKPWFWIRHVSSPTGSPADHWLFLVRNKNCRYDQPDDFAKLGADFPRGAFSMLRGHAARWGIRSRISSTPRTGTRRIRSTSRSTPRASGCRRMTGRGRASCA